MNVFQQIFAGAAKAWSDVSSAINKVFDASNLTPEIAALKANVEQQASNALAFADSSLGPVFGAATGFVVQGANALEAAIPVYGPAAAPVVDPFLDAGIKQGFDLLHASLDHEYARILASRVLPPPVTMKPIPN